MNKKNGKPIAEIIDIIDKTDLVTTAETDSLSSCLYRMIVSKNVDDDETFEFITGLNKGHLDKIRNGKANNMERKTLMAICIGLNVNYAQAQYIFHLSKHNLRTTDPLDSIFLKIIICYPDIGLEKCNKILETLNFPKLGSHDYNVK